jgi:hypothetical protein
MPVGVGVALVVASLVLTACGTFSSVSPVTTPSSLAPTISVPPASVGTAKPPPAFAFYYLWWDTQHWHSRLGPNFPYAQNPLPLPATLTGNGCTVDNLYPGNQLTDVPPQLWTQDDLARIHSDVVLAAKAGLTGFAVGWAGTGQPHQTATSSAFNRRLASLVATVHQVNAAGTPFKLWIAYMSSAVSRTQDYMNNDLQYLQSTYGRDSAFDHSNRDRPMLIMMGSRKYPQWFLDAVSKRWRPSFYLVGDENWDTWNKAKAADFDADQYYWSSQNPMTNPGSFALIEKLAADVRLTKNPDGSAKKFFSPLAPGYNKVIGGGTSCVPRLDGRTMQDLYAGNTKAHPDGWMVISWNEIDEGTYVVPLTRYGMQSLQTLRALLLPGTAGAG